jgi:hypothetical protein
MPHWSAVCSCRHWSTVCRGAQFPSWQGLCLHIFSYLCCTLVGKAHQPKKLAPVTATHIVTNYFLLIASRHKYPKTQLGAGGVAQLLQVQSPEFKPQSHQKRERERPYKNTISLVSPFGSSKCNVECHSIMRRGGHHVHICTHIYTCICPHKHTGMCARAHTCTLVHTHTCMHVCMCACVNVCTCSCVYVCECMHVCIYECVLHTPFS